MQFSICIPVYNVEKYVQEAVESVLLQNYDDYEVIIIDDGSTDNSASICDAIAERDSRVKIIHQKNQGLMMARKKAVEVATGDYLLFLDSDDAYKQGLLEALHHRISESNCDIYIYGMERWYKNKKQRFPFVNVDYKMVTTNEFRCELLNSFQYNAVWLKAIRRTIFSEHVDEIYRQCNYSEDLIQTAYALKYAKSVEIIKDCFYQYRIRKSSLVHKITVEAIVESLQSLRSAEEVIVGENTTDFKANLQIYRKNVLNNCLEQIYRLDLQTIGFAKRKEAIKRIRNNSYYGILLTDEVVHILPFYQRIRLKLVEKNQLILLLLFDYLLRGVQKVVEFAKKEKAFE